MRYKNLLLFVLVIIAIAGVAVALGTPTAQGPGGSYRETCRDISTRGSTLYAECMDSGRNWHRSELRDFDRCGGEIQNLNGNLTCSGGNGQGYSRDHDGDHDRDHDGDHDRGHDRNWVPPGSYSQTCQNIRIEGNKLYASCQKKNRNWHNTSLNNFRGCREIENDNGKLRCR